MTLALKNESELTRREEGEALFQQRGRHQGGTQEKPIAQISVDSPLNNVCQVHLHPPTSAKCPRKGLNVGLGVWTLS